MIVAERKPRGAPLQAEHHLGSQEGYAFSAMTFTCCTYDEAVFRSTASAEMFRMIAEREAPLRSG